MSRHQLQSKSGNHTIAVGWDKPLATFFAIVEHNSPAETDVFDDDESDAPVLWIGISYLELKTPEDLVVPLAPYAYLSAAMLQILRDDRAATLDTGPTPLQRLVRSMEF
jgi:hypothetical protein